MSLSQLYQPSRIASQNTYHWLLLSCEYCSFWEWEILLNTSRSSHLQVFLKIGILKSFANFTRKHWSLFLKNLQSERLATSLKKTPTQVFSCEIYKIFKNIFPCRTPLITASAPPVAASVFFLKCYLQLFCNLVMTYWIFFSSWHIVWYIKSWTRLFTNLLSIVRFSE